MINHPLKFKTYLFYFTILLAGITFGYNISVITNTMIQIKNEFEASSNQVALIAGLMFAGTAIAKLIMPSLNDNFGRRKTLILASIIFCIATLSIIFAKNINIIIIGRTIQGIGAGLLMFTMSIYIVEIANDNNRGRCMALYQLSFAIGLCLANLIGLIIAKLNWQISYIVLLCMAICYLCAMYVLPCSPKWLFYKQQFSKAYDALLLNHNANMAKITITNWHTINFNLALNSIWQKKYLKVLIVIILITCLNQFTGINALLQTSTVLITQAGFSTHFAQIISLIITIINIIGTIIGILIVDKFPRNLLIGYGGLILSIGHLIIAFNAFLGINSSILLLLGLFVFISAFSIGPGIVIWLVFSEYLPTPIRTLGVAISGFINAIAGFFVSSGFLYINQKLGMGWLFLGCAFFSIIYGIIPLMYLPNTTGKDIENFDKLHKK